jgi:hypothetical protein
MALTPAQRVQLLSYPHVKLESVRCDLLDIDGTLLDEIGDEVSSLAIRYTRVPNGAHRSIAMTTTKEMVWGRHQVLPYITISGAGLVDVDVPLGRYVTTRAPLDRGMAPREFNVTGMDLLDLINQPLVRAFTALAGTTPITSYAEQLIFSRGVRDIRLDPTRVDTLSEPRTWTITESLTVLDVTNALLGSISYDDLAMSNLGVAEAGPIIPVTSRPIAWTYDADADDSTVVQGEGHLEYDRTQAHNVWLFYTDALDREGPITQDDGIYLVQNDHNGPSSITALGLAYPAPPLRLDAVSHADLVAQGDRIVAEEMMDQTRLVLETDANPYHRHGDVVQVIDSHSGINGRFLLDEWQMIVLTENNPAMTMNHSMINIEGGPSR